MTEVVLNFNFMNNTISQRLSKVQRPVKATVKSVDPKSVKTKKKSEVFIIKCY